MESFTIHFASDEDWQAAERDQALFGMSCLERGPDGLWRRVDPRTLEPAPDLRQDQ